MFVFGTEKRATERFGQQTKAIFLRRYAGIELLFDDRLIINAVMLR